MKRNILLILVLSFIELAAQTTVRRDLYTIPSSFMPQGFVLASVNSNGFSRLINQQTANLGAINPAAITLYENLSFGLSYQFETNVSPGWIGGIDYSRSRLSKPQSYAGTFKIDDFNVALAFHQQYNAIADLGDIPITTVERPDGTGETYSVSFDEFTDSYSILFGYTFPEDVHNLSFGVRLDYNRLGLKQKFYLTKKNISADEFSSAVGFHFQPDENIVVGAYYERAPKIKKKFLVEVISISLMDSGLIVSPSYYYLKSYQPDIINAALSIRHTETFSTVIDFTYFFWQQLIQNAENSMDVSASFIFSSADDMSWSCGFLFTERNYKNDLNSAFGVNSKLNALFLQAGIEQKFEILQVSLTLLSSYFLSDEWREQLIAKAGIDFYL